MLKKYCVLFGIAIFFGCSVDSEPPRADVAGSVASKRSESLQLGQERSTYVIGAPALSDSEVANRARLLSEIVFERAFVDGPFQASILGKDAALPGTWFGVLDDAEPGLRVRYEYGTDMLIVSNYAIEFQAPLSEDGAVISTAEQARVVFDQTVDRLEAAGLISSADYDLTNVRQSVTDYGEARDDATPDAKVLNFRFTAHRTLDGVRFRDGHLAIAVDRSGKVASIRLRRAAAQITRGPASLVRLSFADCQSRFAKEYPDSHVLSAELGYALHDPQVNGIAEPRCVFSFSTLTPQATGEVVASRRRLVRYSASDPLQTPYEFPAHSVVPGKPRPAR